MVKNTIKKELILAGNYAQLTHYDPPKYVHYGTPPPPRVHNEKTRTSLSRTRIRLFQLVHSNVYAHGPFQPTFLTLTFARNVTELTSTRNELRLYHLRLAYHLQKPLRYIAVPEFQKRGAVHYHIVYFNLPFIHFSILQSIWRHGSIDIHTLKKINSTASYISKYITKDTLDKRFKGHRVLITSRGLKQPQIFTNNEVDTVLQNLHTKKVSQMTVNNTIIQQYAILNRIQSS